MGSDGIGRHRVAWDGMVLHRMASGGIGGMSGIGWHQLASDGMGWHGWHNMASDGMGWHQMAWDDIRWHGMASDGMVIASDGIG